MIPEDGFTMPNLLHSGLRSSLPDVIGSLAELRVDRERIEMLPIGIFRRYRGVVQNQYPPSGSRVRATDPVHVYLAERPISSRLPDGILEAPPSELDLATPVSTPADRSAIPAEEDKSRSRDVAPEHQMVIAMDGGRRFLHVIDTALRRARRDMLWFERSLRFQSLEPQFSRNLLRLLRLDSFDSGNSSAAYAAGSLGGLKDAIGTEREAGAFLERLLDTNLRFTEGPPCRLEIPDRLRSKLGRSNRRLGRDLALGRTIPDQRPSVVLTIGPLSAEGAADWYRDAAGRQSILRAAEAVVPAARSIRIVFKIRREERTARLGRPAHGLLGRTSYLGGARPYNASDGCGRFQAARQATA